MEVTTVIPTETREEGVSSGEDSDGTPPIFIPNKSKRRPEPGVGDRAAVAAELWRPELSKRVPAEEPTSSAVTSPDWGGSLRRRGRKHSRKPRRADTSRHGGLRLGPGEKCGRPHGDGRVRHRRRGGPGVRADHRPVRLRGAVPLMPKVVRVLEILEVMVSRSSISPETEELRLELDKLRLERIDRLEKEKRHRKELELVEDVWRGEAQDLLSQIAQLQEENKTLLTNMSIRDPLSEEELQRHEALIEQKVELEAGAQARGQEVTALRQEVTRLRERLQGELPPQSHSPEEAAPLPPSPAECGKAVAVAAAVGAESWSDRPALSPLMSGGFVSAPPRPQPRPPPGSLSPGGPGDGDEDEEAVLLWVMKTSSLVTKSGVIVLSLTQPPPPPHSPLTEEEVYR
ncbi:hypothetical protein INR49_022597 [Caranx melampygus]|nr:hypothetical protein INR49_022597 [Caranx melampygus]